MARDSLFVIRYSLIIIFLLINASCATAPAVREERIDRGELVDQLERSYLKEYYPAVINIADQLINQKAPARQREPAYYYKGLALMKEERFGESRESFRQLVQFSPRSVLADESLMGIGDSYFIEQDWENARIAYQNLIRSYANSTLLAQVYYKLGRTYEKQGEWSHARRYFSQLVNDYPSSFEAGLVKKLIEEDKFFFTVQVGSFATYSNARRLRDQLTSQGYSAYITESVRRSQVFYRVRIGRMDKRSAAEELARHLRKAGFPTKIYP